MKPPITRRPSLGKRIVRGLSWVVAHAEADLENAESEGSWDAETLRDARSAITYLWHLRAWFNGRLGYAEDDS